MSLWIDPAVERALLQDYHQGQNTLNLRRNKDDFCQAEKAKRIARLSILLEETSREAFTPSTQVKNKCNK